MHIACYIRDDGIFCAVQSTLGSEGITCERVLSEVALLRSLRNCQVNLVLIGTETDIEQEETIRSWLNCRSGDLTPVVVLSHNVSPDRVVSALKAGADDVVRVPFDSGELLARLQAITRRYGCSSTRRVIDLHGFHLERDTGRVLNHGEPVSLTPREFALAWLLFTRPGAYLSRDAISVAVWGMDSSIASRSIEQHIHLVRKKMGLCNERGVWIRTAYTKGYCLQLDNEAAAGTPLPVCEPAVIPTHLTSDPALPRGLQKAA